MLRKVHVCPFCNSADWDKSIEQNLGPWMCNSCEEEFMAPKLETMEFPDMSYFNYEINEEQDFITVDGLSFGLINKLDIEVAIHLPTLQHRISKLLRTESEFSKRDLLKLGENYEEYDMKLGLLTEKLRVNPTVSLDQNGFAPWVRVVVFIPRIEMLKLKDMVPGLLEENPNDKELLELKVLFDKANEFLK